MKRLSKIIPALVVGGMLVTSVSASSGSGAAPNFTLTSRNGDVVSLADLKGQVVMINFWATWCGPCRQEMPLLDALYKRYNRMGFTLLGVNVEEDSSGADKWLADTPVTFPILYDTKNQVSKLYNVTAMPSTVLVDRQGNVRFLHRGYKPGDENDYQNAIRELIREK